MSYQVLARSWRPKNFTDVMGHSTTLIALKNALDAKKLHHAYLFTGTRGVGKTTLARIVAKCLNCEQGVSATPCNTCNACVEINNGSFADVIEIDAASRTKVEDTREILDNIQYQPVSGRFKVYLIDEVHMLSNHSFNALLKTLEEPPEHVKFLLATTDPQKLPATVLSRCLQFNLKLLSVNNIIDQIKIILESENIKFELDALELLARRANGSMRDALSILEQVINYSSGEIKISHVQDIIGIVTSDKIVKLLNNAYQNNQQDLLGGTAELAEYGVDFDAVLVEMLVIIHELTINQENSNIPYATLQQYYKAVVNGRRDMPFAPTPQIGFEIVMLSMLNKTQVQKEQKLGQQESEVYSWEKIVSELNLSGLVKIIAENCVVTKWLPSPIELKLAKKQQVIFNNNHAQKIAKSLSEYLNQNVKVNIVVGDNDMRDTPAAKLEKKLSDDQKQASEAIYRDQNVKELMNTFNATIEQVSKEK